LPSFPAFDIVSDFVLRYSDLDFMIMYLLPTPLLAAGTFFSQFVVAGGPIVWFILIPMSIATVALIIEHAVVIRRKVLLPEGSGRKTAMLLGTRSLAELPVALSRRMDLLSLAIVSVVAHAGHSRSGLRARDLLTDALQERAFQLMRKIEWLNILGNVSPMVGLFGTVVGTIMSLDALSQSGGLASPSKLAGGISVALVTTYWGLLVAIPALTAHGLFRNRIEAIISEAALEAEVIVPPLARLIEPQPVPMARRAMTTLVEAPTVPPARTSPELTPEAKE
jgi:biopolymer transport protein ExbB